MRVEITLNNRVTVVAHVSRFTVDKNVLGDISGFSWKYTREIGQGFLAYVRPESVDAVVAYPEMGDPEFSVNVGGSQDERDAEAAEPGGQQVDPGRDVEHGDPEKDSRE